MRNLKRVLAAGIVSLILALPMTLVQAAPAQAQTTQTQPVQIQQDPGPGQYAPILAACIRKILNLPGLDLPDQPIDLMVGGQVNCPARGG